MHTEELAGAFVELTDTLVNDFDAVELLQVLTSKCVDLLGASAAGLLLADEDGVLRVAVSSSERARLLELYQLQSDEGPCLDCYRQGRAVSIDDLGTASAYWPRFAPTAVDAGYTSVHALPMRVRGQVLGAMNLFGAGDRQQMLADDVPVAQALTDVAAIALTTGQATHRRRELAEQLQTALDSRVAIEQAKGLVAGRLDVGMEESFELLRGFARRRRRRLVEVADEIRGGSLDAAELSAG